jgi:hypothetical protein
MADDPLRGVNAGTVDALLTGVQRFVDAEERRGESLNARASGVAGFVALIISVSAAVARVPAGVVHGTTLTVAVLVFLVAVVVFLGAIGMAIFGVLRPSPGITVADEEIEEYPTYAWIKKLPVEIHGHLMKASIETLKTERGRNDNKAIWLNRAYVSLLIGVGCLAADGLILLHARQDERSQRNTPGQHAPAPSTGGTGSGPTARRFTVLRSGYAGDPARA